VLLADELGERRRAHAHGKRLLRGRHRRTAANGLLSFEKSLHKQSLAAIPAVHQASIYSAAVPDPAELERRTTELLQRLVRFNTVNPPGNEQAAQEYLRDLLEPAGFECEFLSAVEGRPNLVARLRGRSDGPVLCLSGHVDTVLATPSEWSVDPWSGELHDGCVWGRGSLDMKSQVAAEVAAALALCAEGWRPESGDLLIVSVADEEAGSLVGAKWLCETHPDKVRCDFSVNEGGGEMFEFDGRRFYTVCVAEKGVFRFTLSTSGRAGHASIPRIGDNALVKLGPILSRLAESPMPLESSPEPEALLRGLGVLDGDGGVAAALQALEEKDRRLAVLFEPMFGVTLSPTMARASEKINVIPSRAELQVDCRVPPELGEEHARERIRGALGEEDGYALDFFQDEQVVGNRSPIESPLMDRIRAFIEAEDPGATVVPNVLPGFTDSRWWREAFPDCVAYGFFPQNKMDMFEASPLVHAADERIPVEDLGLAARFYSELMLELLG
jgi:acetylornithine deacetylase/succinyl-diaminopimelate desuccinylase-like protein